MVQWLKKAWSENLNDLSSAIFWKSLMAEMLGTSFLVIFGCGSCISASWDNKTLFTLQVSLSFGIAVAIAVSCIAHISGGHINPAVSIAMFLMRRMTLVRVIFYVAVQLVGAIFGGLLLKGITPDDLEGNICTTTVNDKLRSIDALVFEGFGTFVLVFAVFACTDTNRQGPAPDTPFVVGLIVALSHFFGIKYTGSSLNPARTFGSAVASNTWDMHWIYWLGPILGALAAAFIYEFFVSMNASLRKLQHFIIEADYKPDKFYGTKNKTQDSSDDMGMA